MSRGFPDKKIPPIEIVAHDPFRYIGDMLSLVLELAMSEKSFTEHVLMDKRGTVLALVIQQLNTPDTRSLESKFGGQFLKPDTNVESSFISGSLAALLRPLKVLLVLFD